MKTARMNIYIKACSRPAYLDRCITSVRRNTGGFGNIVVLNDGIGDAHIDRLTRRHPGLVVLNSPRMTQATPTERADPKSRTPGADRFDPARFWVDSIGRDLNDHIMVLEEDTWLTEPVDLSLILRNVVSNNVVFFRMFWHGSHAMSCEDEVFLKAVIDDRTSVEFYAPKVQTKVHLFKIFYIAHGIYRTDYWLNSYEGIPYWCDEDYVLERAKRYFLQHDTDQSRLRFAKLNREVIKHSISSTSRIDGGGVGIDQPIDNRLYNDIMNEYWLKGELDPMNNFPRDFSESYLLSIFRKELDRREVADWVAWKRQYVGMYRGMGAFLE